MTARTSLRAIAAAIAFATMLAPSSAPTARAEGAPEAARVAELAVPTTKVLAVGTFTAKARATPGVWRPYIDSEVRQTVELYLSGKIEQWWVKPDQTGVVFLFDSNDVGNVQAQLDALPLGRAGLMEFELIPLGPLSPLRLLLQPASPSR